jgi:hypothetical protein
MESTGFTGYASNNGGTQTAFGPRTINYQSTEDYATKEDYVGATSQDRGAA